MQAVPQTLLLERTPSAEQEVVIAGREETLFIAFVGAQTRSGVSLSVLEQKSGWAVGLCFPPPQQPRSGVTSAIILLTAIIFELFCFNRIIITYYLIKVVLILQKHLQWEIK